jgi:hypothetical protein
LSAPQLSKPCRKKQGRDSIIGTANIGTAKYRVATGEQQLREAKSHTAENKKGRRLASFCVMVGRAGFEPATNWLKANCSTD